ncbi:MAG: ribonuclease HII [Alphaproteobacteria bacterium]|nr:ribonuclease HII [Alphaproteobacteria bacterium]
MPDFFYEKNINDLLVDTKQKLIAGIDEAGRGPLAGPVIAAAVIFPDLNISEELRLNLNDSKKLTAKKRDYLFDLLHKSSAIIGCGQASVEEIDQLNILQATLLAMERAVQNLAFLPNYCLIDGNKLPKHLPCPAQYLVKGDALSLSISAASIIAKVTRDRLMNNLSFQYPQYKWNKNAGYGTKDHLEALEKYGICPHHRTSFSPIKKFL